MDPSSILWHIYQFSVLCSFCGLGHSYQLYKSLATTNSMAAGRSGSNLLCSHIAGSNVSLGLGRVRVEALGHRVENSFFTIFLGIWPGSSQIQRNKQVLGFALA